MKTKNGFVPIVILLLAVLGFIVLGGGAYLLQKTDTAGIVSTPTTATESSNQAAQSRDIIFCNTKMGEAKNGRIYINFEGTTYSFEADTSVPDLLSSTKLSLYGGCGAGGSTPPDWNERITYRLLTLHLPSKSRLIKMTYVCDAPLAGRQFVNCEANGQDKISEYEFGNEYINKISGRADDYDSTYRWEKIIIRKINGKDIVFEGVMYSPSARSSVFGTGKCADNPKYICQTEEEKTYSSYIDPKSLFSLYSSLREFNMTPDMHIYENTVTYSTDAQWYKDLLSKKDQMWRSLQSNEYLINLSRTKNNSDSEKDWNAIIDSFRVENTI
ncbi:MAG: hypothetical protein WCT45_01260 [Candidatus Paceibacterota bacterium]|jgi:hypothetical protein